MLARNFSNEYLLLIKRCIVNAFHCNDNVKALIYGNARCGE